MVHKNAYLRFLWCFFLAEDNIFFKTYYYLEFKNSRRINFDVLSDFVKFGSVFVAHKDLEKLQGGEIFL